MTRIELKRIFWASVVALVVGTSPVTIQAQSTTDTAPSALATTTDDEDDDDTSWGWLGLLGLAGLLGLRRRERHVVDRPMYDTTDRTTTDTRNTL